MANAAVSLRSCRSRCHRCCLRCSILRLSSTERRSRKPSPSAVQSLARLASERSRRSLPRTTRWAWPRTPLSTSAPSRSVRSEWSSSCSRSKTSEPAAAIAELPNLGRKSQAALAAAGITTVAQLRRLGSVAAYVEGKASWRQRQPQSPVGTRQVPLTGLPWQVVARQHRQASVWLSSSAVTPNPSLERTRTGMALGPRGAWFLSSASRAKRHPGARRSAQTLGVTSTPCRMRSSIRVRDARSCRRGTLLDGRRLLASDATSRCELAATIASHGSWQSIVRWRHVDQRSQAAVARAALAASSCAGNELGCTGRARHLASLACTRSRATSRSTYSRSRCGQCRQLQSCARALAHSQPVTLSIEAPSSSAWHSRSTHCARLASASACVDSTQSACTLRRTRVDE